MKLNFFQLMCIIFHLCVSKYVTISSIFICVYGPVVANRGVAKLSTPLLDYIKKRKDEKRAARQVKFQLEVLKIKFF